MIFGRVGEWAIGPGLVANRFPLEDGLEVLGEDVGTSVERDVFIASAREVLVMLGRSDEHIVLAPTDVFDTEIPDLVFSSILEESRNVEMVGLAEFDARHSVRCEELGEFTFEQAMPRQVFGRSAARTFKLSLCRFQCFFHSEISLQKSGVNVNTFFSLFVLESPELM